MDPVSHTLVTRVVLRGRGLSWKRAFALGNWPDIGYYALYPAWLARNGHLRKLVAEEAPVPPRSLEIVYNLTHSLVIVAVLALLLRRRIDRSIFLSWAAHILIDAPTHSRRIYSTRFLWPISGFAFNGWSWAEVLHAKARRRLGRVKPELGP
jgi:membrane-bound metal-dependent hydrolase YbcI (DUF457 family)